VFEVNGEDGRRPLFAGSPYNGGRLARGIRNGSFFDGEFLFKTPFLSGPGARGENRVFFFAACPSPESLVSLRRKQAFLSSRKFFFRPPSSAVESTSLFFLCSSLYSGLLSTVADCPFFSPPQSFSVSRFGGMRIFAVSSVLIFLTTAFLGYFRFVLAVAWTSPLLVFSPELS